MSQKLQIIQDRNKIGLIWPICRRGIAFEHFDFLKKCWHKHFCNLRNFDVKISNFDTKITRIYEKIGSALSAKTHPGHIMLPTGLS